MNLDGQCPHNHYADCAVHNESLVQKKDDIKDFLMQKAVEKWTKENKQFIDDVQNLIHEMVMFEIKYCTKILYDIKKPEK